MKPNQQALQCPLQQCETPKNLRVSKSTKNQTTQTRTDKQIQKKHPRQQKRSHDKFEISYTGYTHISADQLQAEDAAYE